MAGRGASSRHAAGDVLACRSASTSLLARVVFFVVPAGHAPRGGEVHKHRTAAGHQGPAAPGPRVASLVRRWPWRWLEPSPPLPCAVTWGQRPTAAGPWPPWPRCPASAARPCKASDQASRPRPTSKISRGGRAIDAALLAQHPHQPHHGGETWGRARSGGRCPSTRRAGNRAPRRAQAGGQIGQRQAQAQGGKHRQVPARQAAGT